MSLLTSSPTRRIGLALAVGLAFFSVLAAAHEAISVGGLSVSQIEEELQVRQFQSSAYICGCHICMRLNFTPYSFTVALLQPANST
jgi:hypothetical protein